MKEEINTKKKYVHIFTFLVKHIYMQKLYTSNNKMLTIDEWNNNTYEGSDWVLINHDILKFRE